MNLATAAAPETLDGFVGRRRNHVTDDPHLSRYGYMPGVYHAKANPRTTGYEFFPQGALITFETFDSGGHPNPDFFENGKAAPGMIREISAATAAQNAAIEYGAVEGIVAGFALLPMLTGISNARQLFDALHPPFPAIDHVCPFGLDVCPTCRSEWLASDKSKDYFAEYGREIDPSIALEVKEALYTSNSDYATYCVDTWNELSDAYERTRGKENPFVLGKSHHHYRKCAHALTFEDRELNRINTMTSANASAIGEAVRGGSNGNGNGMSDVELAEFYAWKVANAAKGTIQIPSAEVVTVNNIRVDLSPFEIGKPVMCEGEWGTITDYKTAGWFVVTLDSGDVKTVRKDKLEKPDEAQIT